MIFGFGNRTKQIISSVNNVDDSVQTSHFLIKYAATCFTGKVRQNNEDNICIMGKYLPEVHEDMQEIVHGVSDHSAFCSFGVFDGMGGEKCGETASYIGAKAFSDYFRHKSVSPKGTALTQTLSDSLFSANEKVCEYSSSHHIQSMGSTAAAVVFYDGHAAFANIGDSRVYRMLNGRLVQTSVDHVASSLFKSGLVQFLGLPPEEGQIEPETGEWELRKGEKIFLCSDGVTDMLSDSEIGTLLGKDADPVYIVYEMKQDVMKKGAVDNTAIILCETC